MGSFRKLTHINNVKKIYCSSYFNYCLKDNDEFWCWGFGAGYVLGNGQEESLTKAR